MIYEIKLTEVQETQNLSWETYVRTFLGNGMKGCIDMIDRDTLLLHNGPEMKIIYDIA